MCIYICIYIYIYLCIFTYIYIYIYLDKAPGAHSGKHVLPSGGGFLLRLTPVVFVWFLGPSRTLFAFPRLFPLVLWSSGIAFWHKMASFFWFFLVRCNMCKSCSGVGASILSSCSGEADLPDIRAL